MLETRRIQAQQFAAQHIQRRHRKDLFIHHPIAKPEMKAVAGTIVGSGQANANRADRFVVGSPGGPGNPAGR